MRDWWLYLDVGYTRQSGPRCPAHSGCGQDSEQADGHSGRRWLHVDPEGHPRQDHDQYGRHVHLDQEEADVSSKVELHLLTREVAWKTRTKNSAMAPAGCSDAGTNLKVGGGHQSGAKRAKKIFWSCPSSFLALKVQLLVLVSTFVMVSTVRSVSCWLFYSRCPPCPAIFKSGGTCPHALWSRRHCLQWSI